jgi:hypothetical protein
MSDKSEKSEGLTRFREWAQTILWSLMIIAALWGGVASFASMNSQIERNEAKLIDHETRLRANEKTLQQIATDLHWIRKALERERNTEPR